ncbi:MAG: ATP-binding protein, partial [Hydrocarboniphaga effusa]|nr:ATP-binding protein [Hydrocarboniphaga effusa]
MSLEARFLAYALSLAAASALLAALLAQSLPLWLALGLSWLAVFALGTLWLRRCTAPLNRVLEGLNNGLDGFLDRDYSLSLAIARRDELGELVARYNRVGEALRAERQQIHQRELLLESILETNPA